MTKMERDKATWGKPELEFNPIKQRSSGWMVRFRRLNLSVSVAEV